MKNNLESRLQITTEPIVLPENERLTSEEIMDEFKRTKLLNSTTFDTLKEILILADLVKFAKYTPLPDDNDASIRRAYEFVKSTLQSFVASEKTKIPMSKMLDEAIEDYLKKHEIKY